MTMLAELQPGDVPALAPEAAPPAGKDLWARAWRRVMGGRA
jgi:hypothetical protein